jgi:hypothetical protein
MLMTRDSTSDSLRESDQVTAASTATEQPVVLCVPAPWAEAGPTDADLTALAELGITHLWLRDGGWQDDAGAPSRPVDHIDWLSGWVATPGHGLIVDSTLDRDHRRVEQTPLISASWQGSEVDLVVLAAGGDDQLLRQSSSAPVVRMGLRQALLDGSPGVLREAAGVLRGSELVWLDAEVRRQLADEGALAFGLSLLLALPVVPCLGWAGQHGSDEGPLARWPVALSDAERSSLGDQIRLRRTAGVAGRRAEVLDAGSTPTTLALRYEGDGGTLTVTHDLAARRSDWDWSPVAS